MNNSPKIFVVVLNYNGRNTLSACLKSVYQNIYPNFEVVLVDNNSTDGSLEEAKRNFSRAHFIKNPQNLGFSAGNNVGIRFALEKFADYIFLLNSDAYVEKNTLTDLVIEAEKNPMTGLISPLIKKPDGSVWFAGGKIDWLRMRTVHFFKPQKTSAYASAYLSGCALLIKKTVFQQIGLFDEHFFLYYEDADFSLRARRAGFDLLLLPTTTIVHAEQSEVANPRKLYWLVLSGLFFFRKNTPFIWKPWLMLYLGLRKSKNFFACHAKQNTAALEVRKAYQDFRKHY